MDRLDPKALAIAVGAAWGSGILLAGWAASFGWCGRFVHVMSSIYFGYGPGLLGGIVGGIWGFIDGAIGGLIIALVYNWAAGRKKG